MSDEPSLGELGRLIQAMRADFREDMLQINARLDRLVSADVYAVEKAAMHKDITELAKAIEQVSAQQKQDMAALQEKQAQDAARVTQTRRFVVASVIIPVLGLFIPVVLFLAGGNA